MFIMTGENDDRGALLEAPEAEFDLFFRQDDRSRYRYEGAVRFQDRMAVPGEPIRRFTRL